MAICPLRHLSQDNLPRLFSSLFRIIVRQYIGGMLQHGIIVAVTVTDPWDPVLVIRRIDPGRQISSPPATTCARPSQWQTPPSPHEKAGFVFFAMRGCWGRRKPHVHGARRLLSHYSSLSQTPAHPTNLVGTNFPGPDVRPGPREHNMMMTWVVWDCARGRRHGCCWSTCCRTTSRTAALPSKLKHWG